MKMIIGNQLAIDKETVRCLNMYLSTTLQDYNKTGDGQSDRQASLALFSEANRIKVNGSAGYFWSTSTKSWSSYRIRNTSAMWSTTGWMTCQQKSISWWMTRRTRHVGHHTNGARAERDHEHRVHQLHRLRQGWAKSRWTNGILAESRLQRNIFKKGVRWRNRLFKKRIGSTQYFLHVHISGTFGWIRYRVSR